MAYLDWDHVEDERIEAQVEAQMAEEAASGQQLRRRGIKDIWAAAKRDVEEIRQ